jgi:hypothetical protein
MRVGEGGGEVCEKLCDICYCICYPHICWEKKRRKKYNKKKKEKKELFSKKKK